MSAVVIGGLKNNVVVRWLWSHRSTVVVAFCVVVASANRIGHTLSWNAPRRVRERPLFGSQYRNTEIQQLAWPRSS